MQYWRRACGWRRLAVRPRTAAEAQGVAIAVIDFDYVDTSGEERDQRKEHEARVGAIHCSDLKGDLGQAAKFRLVTLDMPP